MRTRLLTMIRDDRATAAAETLLVLPVIFALLFGTFEIGNYFLTEHKVVKAVRDGARYAARQPYADYSSCTPSSGLVDRTRNVTRTGQVASGGTPRVDTWSNPSSITVSATCDSSGTYSTGGIYVSSTMGTPVVTVAATVPYTPLLAQLGLANVSLGLNARSHAAVTAI